MTAVVVGLGTAFVASLVFTSVLTLIAEGARA